MPTIQEMKQTSNNYYPNHFPHIHSFPIKQALGVANQRSIHSSTYVGDVRDTFDDNPAKAVHPLEIQGILLKKSSRIRPKAKHLLEMYKYTIKKTTKDPVTAAHMLEM